MPSLIEPQKELTRKRKREGRGLSEIPTDGVRPVEDGKREPDVDLLEDQITQSRRYLNNIATLIGYVRASHNNAIRSSQAVVALCRIFSRLLASGSMTRSSHQSEAEIVVVEWLHDRLGEYRSLLLDSIAQSHNGEQKASLELLMHLAKEEATSLKLDANTVWRRGTFPLILRAVVSESSSEQLRRNFVEKYIQDNDDLLLYTLKIIAYVMQPYL
jgi:U3 small nucleolar RNA-associated protein 19